MRIRSEDFARALRPYEDRAAAQFSWLVSTSYKIAGEWIFSEPGDGGFRNTLPSEDPELFRSFYRLGVRGEPSKNAIRRWVSQYGLLLHEDQTSYTPAGAPMKVEQFRREVLCAYQMVELYKSIRTGDQPTLRRLMVQHKRHPASDWPNTPRTLID